MAETAQSLNQQFANAGVTNPWMPMTAVGLVGDVTASVPAEESWDCVRITEKAGIHEHTHQWWDMQEAVKFLKIRDNASSIQPPIVDAGADQTITLPSVAVLDGNASQGSATNSVTVSWSKFTGPGLIGFDNPNAASTTASISDPGVYVLRLSAEDGSLSSIDDVTITVNPPYLDPSPSPLVSDLTVASGRPYQVMDDGLVSGAPFFIDRNFTFKSIPATVQGATYIKTANDDKGRKDTAFLSFQPNQDVTVYVAYDHRASSFPDWLKSWNSTGESITTTDVSFKIFARDFAASSTITLGGNLATGAVGAASNYFVVVAGQAAPVPTPIDQPPTVDAGPDLAITLPALAQLDGTASDDGLPNPPGALSIQWSQVSGPGSAYFADASAASTTATFSDPGDYVLELTADDGNLSSSVQVTITVNPPALVISGLTAASGKPYQVVDDGLVSGAPFFIDRNFTFKSIPATLQGATYIKTANDDKSRKDTSFLSFQVGQDTTVYVAYDHRASSLPDWLTGWDRTGKTIDTTDVSFDLYAKNFDSSSNATLGGNMASGAAGVFSNYFVVLRVVPSVNQAPDVSIVSPQDGASLSTIDTITFSGLATDPEDGGLPPASLVWSSSIDGEIGTGGYFQASLSAGSHLISLVATDNSGASSIDTIEITVLSQVYGDANGDEQVSIEDAHLVIDWLLGQASIPEDGSPRFLASDVNGDNTIDSGDLTLLIDYLAGKISRFPVDL